MEIYIALAVLVTIALVFAIKVKPEDKAHHNHWPFICGVTQALLL